MLYIVLKVSTCVELYDESVQSAFAKWDITPVMVIFVPLVRKVVRLLMSCI